MAEARKPQQLAPTAPQEVRNASHCHGIPLITMPVYFTRGGKETLAGDYAACPYIGPGSANCLKAHSPFRPVRGSGAPAMSDGCWAKMKASVRLLEKTRYELDEAGKVRPWNPYGETGQRSFKDMAVKPAPDFKEAAIGEDVEFS